MIRTNSKRERLTAAARRLIHATGYTQTTLADIAQAADVPLGNVYYYFKTKDALAQAVIVEQLQEFKQLTQELDRLSDPRARIDGFLSMLVLESEPIAAHGCPVGSLCTELNKGDNPLAKLANGMLQAQLDWLTRQFQQMGKTEEALELALQLLAQLQGATVLTHVFNDPNMFTRQIVNAKSWLYDIA
jgi:TetR/AcrR family transcriptional repressor of nem operon